MTVSLVAVDYSRPIQPMFKQTSRAGIIHSVFHKVTNIALDDAILALSSNELPRMPNSMRLPPVEAEELLRSLRPGMVIRIGDGRLFIPAHDFSLYLPETPPWEPRPEITAYHWCRETVAGHARLLAHYLADRPQQDGLAPLPGPLLLGRIPSWETPLSRMALPVLRKLALASRQRDIAGVEEAARGLAGLGPGLTPSGDDALAGFAAVMALLGPQLSTDAAPRDHIAAAIVMVARPRTTALSAALLAHAAQGEVAEQLGKLLLTLTLPAEAFETVQHAADRVLAFGATSGSDTLLGMLLGLQALERDFD